MKIDEGFEEEAIEDMTGIIEIATPGEGRLPIVIGPGIMPGNGSGNALHIDIRFQLLRAMDISVADLHGPSFGRIESETGRIGIEARAIEVPTIFVGLASRENGSIEFELAPNIPKGGYAKGDVGGIKPMM